MSPSFHDENPILKLIKNILLIVLFIFIKLFGWLFKGTRKTVDLGVDAYQSVKNSQSFDEAYRNFATNKYAKARLSVPEEVIALMAKVAASDGKISELEVEYMSDTIVSIAKAMQAAGLSQPVVDAVKQKLFKLANTAKRDENPVTYYCYALSRSGEGVRQGALLQIISFATLDGLSDDTQQVLQQIGQALQFSPEQVAAFIEQVHGGGFRGFGSGMDPNQPDPYDVLGCAESDDFTAIKQAYRKLVKQYHPDYMHGQGMADADIQQATQKMQEINAAYETIKRRRGV